MAVARTQSEVDAAIAAAQEIVESVGTRTPARSYEEGVEAALRWVVGEAEDPPINPDR